MALGQYHSASHPQDMKGKVCLSAFSHRSHTAQNTTQNGVHNALTLQRNAHNVNVHVTWETYYARKGQFTFSEFLKTPLALRHVHLHFVSLRATLRG